VRYLPEGWLDQPGNLRTKHHIAVDHYHEFPRAYEAYHHPGYSPPEGHEANAAEHPVWGNSQFSIRRDTLAALAAADHDALTVDGVDGRPLLAYDESYPGRGLNDLDYLKRIERAAGELGSYRGHLVADGPHALLHLTHPYEEAWDPTETDADGIRRHTATEANRRRFKELWP